MTHRALNLCSAVSLLLCIATALFWVRSYRITDSLGYTGQRRATEVASCYQMLSVWLWVSDDDVPPGTSPEIWCPGLRFRAFSPPHEYARPSFSPPVPFRLARITFSRSSTSANQSYKAVIWHLECPMWMVALVTATLPSWWICRSYYIRRRKRRGFCSSCGYDLRASPNRCPECGYVPRSDQPAAA